MSLLKWLKTSTQKYMDVSDANPLPVTMESATFSGTVSPDVTDRDTRQLGVIKRIEEGVVDPRDMRGLASAKPAANAGNRGYTYWSVDTDPHQNAVEVSDGTSWVVI